MIGFREAAHRILEVTHGRTTAFFVSFFIAGHLVLAFGHLTGTYISFMATLGGLILGHSIKEDILGGKKAPDADDKN